MGTTLELCRKDMSRLTAQLGSQRCRTDMEDPCSWATQASSSYGTAGTTHGGSSRFGLGLFAPWFKPMLVAPQLVPRLSTYAGLQGQHGRFPNHAAGTCCICLKGLDAPGACGHRLTCGHLMHEECVTEPLGLHGRFQDFPAISQLPRKALHYRNDRPLTSARPSNMPPTPSMRCWLRSALASGFRRRCKSASL